MKKLAPYSWELFTLLELQQFGEFIVDGDKKIVLLPEEKAELLLEYKRLLLKEGGDKDE